MKEKEKKILSQINPYLRDRSQRRAGLFKSVCSSSAIEGIDAQELLTSYLRKKKSGIIPSFPEEKEQSHP